jgi:hypothetical protein
MVHTLGAYLLVLFLLTLGYLVFFALPGARRRDGEALGKAVTAGYLLGSVLLLLLLLLQHLAFPGGKVAAAVRHIEFRGVGVTLPSVTGATSNVRITGDPIDVEADVQRGFRWFALPSGSWIDVRPDVTEGNKILSYRAVAHHPGQVVRLSERCINETVGGWAKPGETARYKIDRTASQGKRARASVEFGIEAQSGSVRVRPDGQWTRLVNRSSLRDVLVASGALKLRDSLASYTTPSGTSILDTLEVVRYQRGEGDSAGSTRQPQTAAQASRPRRARSHSRRSATGATP